MSIADTIAGARDSARQHRSQTRLESVAKEKDDLTVENRVLRDELAENRSERKQILELLEQALSSSSGPRKRRSKLLWFLAASGVTYAVVTKTGIASRVKAWVDTMRSRTGEFGSDLEAKGSDITDQVRVSE